MAPTGRKTSLSTSATGSQSSRRINKHPKIRQPKNKKQNRSKQGSKVYHPRQTKPSNFDMISVTQINLRRKQKAWSTLISNIHGRRNPIVLATEPYTTKNNLLPKVHKDLTPFYYKKGDVRPRAALLTHKNLEDRVWELTQFTTPDQVAIKIKHDSKELILASSYMDGNKVVPPPELAPLVAYANQQKLPLIVGSDTNSHHILWGNKETKDRGEELLDFLDSCGLSWANKGSTSTFLNSRGQNTIIDLTIINNAGGDLISNWHVSQKHSNSDHRYIMFDLASKCKTAPKQIRFVKNTDWNKFQDCLDSNENLTKLNETNLTTKVDLDQAASDLNQILNEAFEYACPITYISSTIKKPPWLTPEVQEAQRGIRHKLMIARNTKSDSAWQSLRESGKTYDKLLEKTQRKEWRSFCEQTESVRESARMNKILKSCSDKKEKLESLYKSDNTLTKNAEETLDVLVDTHFREGPADELAQVSDNAQPITPAADLVDMIYDHSRLTEAVKAFDPDTAAGPDNIKPIIIQKAWDRISTITRKIMIGNHKLQHVPAVWMESKGIFLAKPGKTDYNQPKSFRTITLSPVLLKLQEKAILWHMQHDLKMNDQSSDRQFGFKKGCSTETALHKVVHRIERRIAKKGHVIGTFLDIEGAFDNVSFKAISEAINASPVDKSTAKWIINMVTNRYVTISLKDSSRRIRIKRGCPQGGILSPFLWNLIVDDLLKFSAKDIPGYLQAFADDLISLVEGGSDTDVTWKRTQKTIATIENWCKTKGLNISALKTKIVMFTWNQKWSLRPIKVGGTTIELSNSVRFLGVTLDHKLYFNEHILNITKKATATLMQCKRAVGPTWGLTPKTCRWIYTTVVRPILSYCAVVWVRALNTQHNVKKLERVQALALRIMSGAMPSTPFRALDHITNTPNIATFLRGEAAKGAARLDCYNDWTGEAAPSGKGLIIAHSTISNEFLAEFDLPKSAERDLTKPILTLNRNYDISIPKEEDIPVYRRELPDTIINITPETITCYSDGSQTDDGTGFGYIVTRDNNNVELSQASAKMPDFCSVYQAELTAIMAGAETLADCKEQNILFWSDSLSSLQSLSNKTMNSKTVIQCHKTLNELARHNTVKVRWIAAHDGHWGNEKADDLAKGGTKSNTCRKGYLPQSFIKTAINNKVKRLDKEAWAHNGHEHTNLTLGSKHEQIKHDLNKVLIKNRTQYRTAVQLITGHAALNKYLHKIKKVDTDICPNCGYEVETVNHFLGQCPAFAQQRGEIFNSFYLSASDIFENHSILKIVKYAAKTKRFLYPENSDESGVT